MPEKPHVTIVGAGMAGLTAALRLAERGYRITLFERAPYIGGQFGVLKVGDFYHEHCYHMFLNWYNNFWKIVDELGIRDRFIPRSTIKFSERGAFPTMTEVVDVGSPWTAWRNLLSGVLPIPDMYIYGYSLLDLAAQPFNHEKFLDRFSINGFMRSRWYGTDSAAQQYQRTLAKAFASPTYKTSAESYQNLIKFGFRYPSPMMWILQDNCYEAFLRPFEQRLEQLGCEIRRNRDVKRLVFDAGKRRITQ
ncbi:MAG: FAD-dependent oxidoreductase, partial [Gammaproteobacteria bacterium]